MSRIKSELKIMGTGPILISSALVVAFALLAVFGGELLNLSVIGFEVIFPFFAAIAVGEWGKTRADESFDVIAAQSRSLFSWVKTRFITVFLLISLFAALGMAAVFLTRGEMPIHEMALMYLSPALFLSSLAALLNLCFSQEHISALVCGGFWLLSLLTRSLLRFRGVQYAYLFIRYAGDLNGVWLKNKLILLSISAIMWCVIFYITHHRSSIFKAV